MCDSLPDLTRVCTADVCVHTDVTLCDRTGIVVAFSERSGGASHSHYHSLNLAGHVRDDPAAVDKNRDRLLAALGLPDLRGNLVTCEQVHGEAIACVEARDAGRGAFAATGTPPVPAADALMTLVPGIPLLLLYADCVPVVLVCEHPRRAVAVVHAGWRGTLVGLPGKTAANLAQQAGCPAAEIRAYVGPHIGRCCYEVDESLLSQFVEEFGTIAAVDGHLDLGACVGASLVSVGVRPECVARVNECTMDHVDRYFSYRASGVTGRHGALAVITKVG